MGRGRVDFDRGIARLAAYARYHGHANPKADEIWLGWSVGLWVASLRVKFPTCKLADAQIAAAEDIRVRFTPPYRDPKPKPPSRSKRKEGEYVERLKRLDDFYTAISTCHSWSVQRNGRVQGDGLPVLGQCIYKGCSPGGHQVR